MTLICHVLVDANVARSAAETSKHPTTVACLMVAKTLLSPQSRSGLAMTPALQAEWRKHASQFMTRWLVSMESRRRVKRMPDQPVRDLDAAIKTISDKGIRDAIQKDLHLSAAALYFGLPVVSRDETQKRYLTSLSSEYSLLAKLQWVNPETYDDCEAWLLSGCTIPVS